MAMRFLYNNISFKPGSNNNDEGSLVVTGEITNDSGRDFNAVVFKMVLFIKTRCIGHLTITMNGFRNGQTKTFREMVSELELVPGFKIMPELIRYEIYPESAY
jgi:hypothetical protein